MFRAAFELFAGLGVALLSMPMMLGGDATSAVIVLILGAIICFDSLFRMARS